MKKLITEFETYSKSIHNNNNNNNNNINNNYYYILHLLS
jgi:hypothetical protein